MIRFNNDYNHTAHEKVLEAVMNTAAAATADMARMNGVGKRQMS